jgi:hypothetical protein
MSLRNHVAVTLALGLAFLGLALAQEQQQQQPPSTPRLVSPEVERGPEIDGRADDAAWRKASALEVVVRRPLQPNEGASTDVHLRSVHTSTHVYFLVRWRDETRDDVAHKPWVWNAAKNAYEEGPEREDMLALAFQHTGTFDADMLSGQLGVWDVWQWKAVRTNPQGYAMDRTHRYTAEKPEGKANSHQAKNGQTIWIARPEDAGDTVERKQPAPATHQGDRVPQYLPGTPVGSAADVRAKGTWEGGWWTLELGRQLNTGNADDTPFEQGLTYRFGVGTHDRTGDMDKASGVLELAIASREKRGIADQIRQGR